MKKRTRTKVARIFVFCFFCCCPFASQGYSWLSSQEGLEAYSKHNPDRSYCCLAHAEVFQGLHRNIRRKAVATDIPSSQGLHRKVHHKVVTRLHRKVCRKVSPQGSRASQGGFL